MEAEDDGVLIHRTLRGLVSPEKEPDIRGRLESNRTCQFAVAELYRYEVEYARRKRAGEIRVRDGLWALDVAILNRKRLMSVELGCPRGDSRRYRSRVRKNSELAPGLASTLENKLRKSIEFVLGLRKTIEPIQELVVEVFAYGGTKEAEGFLDRGIRLMKMMANAITEITYAQQAAMDPRRTAKMEELVSDIARKARNLSKNAKEKLNEMKKRGIRPASGVDFSEPIVRMGFRHLGVRQRESIQNLSAEQKKTRRRQRAKIRVSRSRSPDRFAPASPRRSRSRSSPRSRSRSRSPVVSRPRSGSRSLPRVLPARPLTRAELPPRAPRPRGGPRDTAAAAAPRRVDPSVYVPSEGEKIRHDQLLSTARSYKVDSVDEMLLKSIRDFLEKKLADRGTPRRQILDGEARIADDVVRLPPADVLADETSLRIFKNVTNMTSKPSFHRTTSDAQKKTILEAIARPIIGSGRFDSIRTCPAYVVNDDVFTFGGSKFSFADAIQGALVVCKPSRVALVNYFTHITINYYWLDAPSVEEIDREFRMGRLSNNPALYTFALINGCKAYLEFIRSSKWAHLRGFSEDVKKNVMNNLITFLERMLGQRSKKSAVMIKKVEALPFLAEAVFTGGTTDFDFATRTFEHHSRNFAEVLRDGNITEQGKAMRERRAEENALLDALIESSSVVSAS